MSAEGGGRAAEGGGCAAEAGEWPMVSGLFQSELSGGVGGGGGINMADVEGWATVTGEVYWNPTATTTTTTRCDAAPQVAILS